MLRRGVGRRTLVMSGATLAAGGWPLGLRAQPALEIGVLPHLSTRSLMALYRPVREGLQRQLQRNVQLSTAPDWGRFHQRVMALDYDCMVSAAHLARLAQVDAGWMPLVSYAPPIQALLIAAQDRPLASPQDLKGGRLLLANRQSLVALTGLHWLADQGLQAGVDFQVATAGRDDSVGALLARGACDAALLSAGELLALPTDMRSRVITVQAIGEVPAFVVSASPQLNTASRRELFRAWLAFGRDDASAAFYAGSAFSSIEPVASDTLKALDHLLPQCRQLLGAPT
jgi:phosphonate transport system substrate-binding protein